MESELAQNNIFNLIDKLDVDLHTHVVIGKNIDHNAKFFDADALDIEY